MFKKINAGLKWYLAWLTTDPVIWAVLRAKNKEGKKCNLIKEWKNHA